jgi:hypothetical protein
MRKRVTLMWNGDATQQTGDYQGTVYVRRRWLWEDAFVRPFFRVRSCSEEEADAFPQVHAGGKLFHYHYCYHYGIVKFSYA